MLHSRQSSPRGLAVQTTSPTSYRFGPFEVIVASGELLKNGKRVRLQELPFKLLLILLENSGEVVPRTVIQQGLWEGNTFVDFDSGLRVALGKLREALGDDADRPRYVETIPKRGYRFIGELDKTADIPVSHPSEPLAPPQPFPASSPAVTRSDKWLLVALVLVLVGGGAVAFRFNSRHPNRLTERDTVVLADFTNSTGDPVFDETLRRGMVVQLEQSPFLNLTSDDSIRAILRQMGKAPDAHLTPELAREICERTAGAAVLDGSISSLGNQYVIGLRATNCQSGAILDEEQAQAAEKEDVLRALDRIANDFRGRVGESLPSVQKYGTPLELATTPSLDALKAYSAGWRLFFSSGHAAAIPLMRHAIEIDPQFAMAYASLGRMYSGAEQPLLARQNIAKAYQLRERASDLEKFFITANYQIQVTGDLEKAEETCLAWTQAYPRDFHPHSFLGSMIYLVMGKHPQALEQSQIALSMVPDLGIEYALVAMNNQYVGRLTDAEQTLERAAQHKLDLPDFIVLRYDLAFLKNDTSGMQHAGDLARGRPGAEDWVTNHEASVLAYSGRLQEARIASRHAVDLAEPKLAPERAALFEVPVALWEGFFGESGAAKRSAAAAMSHSQNNPSVTFAAAFALALAGDTAQAQRLANKLERELPEDSSFKFNHLPAIHALVAVQHRNPEKAIDLLRIAVPYEFGVPRTATHGNFGALYPIYVRGLAYLALHRGSDAAAEFQKILDHRNIVVSDPVGAVAQPQLARAYAASGNRLKSAAAYRDFLRLWSHADPTLPLLIQVRSELAKLQ